MNITTDETSVSAERRSLARVDDTFAATGGARQRNGVLGRRSAMIVLLLGSIFAAVAGRPVSLGMVEVDDRIEGVARDLIQASRPPILDRNGIVLALDVRVPSLYAEPRRIIDVDEAVEKLRTVLPDLIAEWLRQRLTCERGFAWIKRELTPAIEDQIMALVIPGIAFIQEGRRFYPPGYEISHVIGGTNLDNQGIAGMELALDRCELVVLKEAGLARGTELEPKVLSIDLRVQHLLHEELSPASVQGDRRGRGGAGHPGRRSAGHGVVAPISTRTSRRRRCRRTGSIGSRMARSSSIRRSRRSPSRRGSTPGGWRSATTSTRGMACGLGDSCSTMAGTKF